MEHLRSNAPVWEQESVEDVVVSRNGVVLGLFTSSGAASVWNLQRAFFRGLHASFPSRPTYKTTMHRSGVRSAASALSARCAPATASTASLAIAYLAGLEANDAFNTFVAA